MHAQAYIYIPSIERVLGSIPHPGSCTVRICPYVAVAVNTIIFVQIPATALAAGIDITEHVHTHMFLLSPQVVIGLFSYGVVLLTTASHQG